MSANIAPARQAAFDILRKIGLQLGNSDALLHSESVDRLSQQDRNLCTALVLGTLRWQRVLDIEFRRFLSRPDLTLAADSSLALRLGTYQLRFLDRIPPHAAIFESVEWAKQSDGARQSGLVNAVLRKVAALPKMRSYDAELAYPDWMVARWRKSYGVETCRRICEEGQQEPPTALRLLDAGSESREFVAGATLEPGKILAKARLLVNGATAYDLSSLDLQIQDEGSQLIAELVGTGHRILDCCAAPGGKTAVLRQNNPEAQLLACDIHRKRLAAMRGRFAKTSSLHAIDFRIADAAKLANVGPFDRILCDAPCTGTGTLMRNPEIRHRLQPHEIERQAARQREILSAALRLLAPGGRLLYATCSLEPEENEDVVKACLQEATTVASKFRKLDLRDTFDQLARQGTICGEAVPMLRANGFRDGHLRTLPGVHPCDGFCAVMMERE